MGFNDEPMIKQKSYSEEEYRVKKDKSFGVAKRTLIMAEVCTITLNNLLVALVLFILLMMGTGAMPYFVDVNIEFTQENFPLRGGYFITICVVFLLLLVISGFWYAIGYKRLEIMCIHLDGELQGAIEVKDVAQRDKFVNSIGIDANYSSLGGPAIVSYNYLRNNGINIVNSSVFTVIRVLLIVAQIIFAGVCLLVLMN